jgi:osmotically-inducible protein OsmY
MMIAGCRSFAPAIHGKARKRGQRRRAMSNKPSDQPGTFGGPGYSGFGGSAGYSGAGVGGVSGAYTGGDFTTEPWRPAPDTHHDDQIHDDVWERMQQAANLDASQIEVSVEAGVVTLEGQVEDRDMKHAAGELAERTPGVHRVHNRLHVGPPLLQRIKEKLTGRP